MMGVASNKGAIAIRMDYGDTSFCFVAAHFASGKSNVDDRNSDFHTINNGIKFLKGRTIDNHEYEFCFIFFKKKKKKLPYLYTF
jgi:hypothetical protein